VWVFSWRRPGRGEGRSGAGPPTAKSRDPAHTAGTEEGRGCSPNKLAARADTLVVHKVGVAGCRAPRRRAGLSAAGHQVAIHAARHDYTEPRPRKTSLTVLEPGGRGGVLARKSSPTSGSSHGPGASTERWTSRKVAERRSTTPPVAATNRALDRLGRAGRRVGRHGLELPSTSDRSPRAFLMPAGRPWRDYGVLVLARANPPRGRAPPRRSRSRGPPATWPRRSGAWRTYNDTIAPEGSRDGASEHRRRGHGDLKQAPGQRAGRGHSRRAA